MAKQMDYTDPSGVVHKDSIWIPLTINISHLDNCGRVEFFGFKDKQSAILAILNHKDKVKPLYGAVKGYDFNGSKYNQLVYGLINKNLNSYLECLAEACVLELADKIFDTPSKEDLNVKVSFFDGAIDVELTGD